MLRERPAEYHRRRFGGASHDGSPGLAANTADGPSGAPHRRHRPADLQTHSAGQRGVHDGELLVDARRGHGPQPAGPHRRSGVAHLQPSSREFRDRLVRAAERRRELRARPWARRRARAPLRRPVGHAHRRDRPSVGRHRGQPRLRTGRERSRRARGGLQRRERGDVRAGAALLRTRVCDQVVRDVSAAVRPAWRHGGSLSGWAALHARAG